jgi:hypothetical protein
MKTKTSITKSKSGHYHVTVRSTEATHVVGRSGKVGSLEEARLVAVELAAKVEKKAAEFGKF